MEETRRADLQFSLSYDTDLKAAKAIFTKVLADNPKVLETPEPMVIVKTLTESSIQIAVRPWAKSDEFFAMTSEVLEQCKESFENAGMNIQPYVRESSVLRK
jgi:small conductance mechanosensitive channel